MTVDFYKKPKCQPCDATKRKLDKYEDADIRTHEALENLDLLNDLGHMSAPVLVVKNAAGEVVDHWSGFKPDKIEEYLGKVR